MLNLPLYFDVIFSEKGDGELMYIGPSILNYYGYVSLMSCFFLKWDYYWMTYR